MAPVLDSSVLRNSYFEDNWVWDQRNKSPEVYLSSNHQVAYFHIDPVIESTGTAGVRGNKGFSNGEHYWEVSLLVPAIGTSIMIGVGTRDALLHTDNYQSVNLVGLDKNSWGLSYKGKIWHEGKGQSYCEAFYSEQTVIGVYLNLYDGTLTYFKDGESLGIAFRDLNKIGQDLFPIISSTTSEIELGVGIRTCRYMSLQEKCHMSIAKTLHHKQDIDKLPLPSLIKEHLIQMKV